MDLCKIQQGISGDEKLLSLVAVGLHWLEDKEVVAATKLFVLE